jgi:hypothetical protein
VLGIQTYIHREPFAEEQSELSDDANSETSEAAALADDVRPSELRLIVTRHSAHLCKLKEGLIDHFLRCEDVDKNPVDSIRC